MKLAFLIQAHKNFEQLQLLINYLSENGVDVYVHIDKKNEKLKNQMIAKYNKKLNVCIIEKSINVNWSGFSQVEATLKMMKVASKKKYDYLNLVSGQDLLIKPISELKEFLKKNKGIEFIEFEDIKNKKWKLKKYSMFRENSKNRTIFYKILDNLIRRLQPTKLERKNLKGYEKLYTGSQWFTLTGDAVNYILEVVEKSNIKKEFKYTACSDEHFFQIILLNSKFNKRCINNNLRYMDWHDCKNSPKILEIKDIDRLKFTSNFFARKFDIEIDIEVINKIYFDLQK